MLTLVYSLVGISYTYGRLIAVSTLYFHRLHFMRSGTALARHGPTLICVSTQRAHFQVVPTLSIALDKWVFAVGVEPTSPSCFRTSVRLPRMFARFASPFVLGARPMHICRGATGRQLCLSLFRGANSFSLGGRSRTLQSG